MTSTITLRATFLPQWYGNPYQHLLEEGLKANGVRMVHFSQTPVAIFKGLIRHRPHILHLHWLHPFYENARQKRSWLRMFFSLKALLFVRLCGVRVVWTAHNLEHHEAKESRIDRFFTSIVARLARRIIVHGAAARDRLLERFPQIDPNKVEVIPHGHYIDCYANDVSCAEARERLGIGATGTGFLFFGQIRPYKGVLELIEAFGQLADKDAFLVIAGKPLDDATEGLVQRAIGTDARIHSYPGFVADDDVQVYMNACDVVALPYRDALTSGAALLAMSFGKACVAPRTPCFTELFDDSRAFLYDPNVTNALRHALGRAIDERHRLPAIGHANLEAAQSLDWIDIGRQTRQCYLRALGRSDNSTA